MAVEARSWQHSLDRSVSIPPELKRLILELSRAGSGALPASTSRRRPRAAVHDRDPRVQAELGRPCEICAVGAREFARAAIGAAAAVAVGALRRPAMACVSALVSGGSEWCRRDRVFPRTKATVPSSGGRGA